jgi:hypothetical protein
VAKRIEEGNQMELFGGAPERPARRPPRRAPAPEAAAPEAAAPVEPPPPPPPAEPPPAATLAALAATATHPDLEDLLAALGDEALAFLAVAALRELRQRVARPKRRGAGEAAGSPAALRRALRRLAEDLAQDEG